MATKVTLTSRFPAGAESALAALSNEAVLDEVMRESESLDPVVEVRRQPGHVEIHIKRSFSEDWPALVASFIGDRLQIEEERRWQQTGPGQWSGHLKLHTPGLPVELTAALELSDIETGSELTIDGLLRCSVPFIGGKVEQMAADLVADGFRLEAEVAARHCH